MRILALGDIVGANTVAYLNQTLRGFRRKERIDFVIANGENATDIHGLAAREASALLDAGADIITLGNHTYGKRDLYPVLEQDPRIIRPANFPAEAPGMGYTLLTVCGWRLLCVSISGRVFMDDYASPFETVDRILKREAGHYDLAIMDIHAEATSEKMALARYFDGRVAVMFGTHTHVPTADEQILPGGSAYQTDVGMCGPVNGIIGTKTEPVLAKFRTLLPAIFTVADGEIVCHGTVFETDGAKIRSVQRVVF